jgi:hypothetical protein
MVFKKGDRVRVISKGEFPGTYLKNKDKIGTIQNIGLRAHTVIFDEGWWYVSENMLELVKDEGKEAVDLETYLKNKNRGF